MKNLKIVSITMLVLAFVTLACNFSTANLSSLKTSKDKDGKEETTSFKVGDTLFAKATVSNNGGKVKVKLYLVADDVKGAAKGETIKGTEVSVDIDGDGFASYNVPMIAPGSYTLNADMINDAGEKKDNKSAKITVTGDAAPTAPAGDAPKTDDSANTESSDSDE